MSTILLDVTSPGSQTSQRAVFERRVQQESTRALGVLLDDVHLIARQALDAPVLIAAGQPREPFTLGAVRRLWSSFVDTVGWALVSTVGTDVTALDSPPSPTHSADGLTAAQRLGVTDPFVVSTLDRLEAIDLPAEIHTSALSVLTQDTRKVSRKQLLAALSAALDPETGRVITNITTDDGTSTEGDSWAVQAQRIARTESTALFSHFTEQEISRKNYPGKRWVSVRDNRVRHSHAEVNGTAVRVGETFIVGGYAMTGPGDPSAPYSERANCRCHLIGLGFKAARAAGIR